MGHGEAASSTGSGGGHWAEPALAHQPWPGLAAFAHVVCKGDRTFPALAWRPVPWHPPPPTSWAWR